MDARPWRHHLRLLPGGDAGVGSALATSVTLYVVFFFMGLTAAGILGSSFGPQTGLGGLEVFSLANALPCFVISLWTGLRVRGSRPLGLDEAAVHLEHRRVYFGDEVPRAPRETVTFSIRPRQVSARLADGRQVTAFFRVNADPEDLVGLAREMQGCPGLAVEDWVHGLLKRLADELLPDPDGVREALAKELLRCGVVVTRFEVSA
ncbi:MAG: hypothetical protein M9894_27300 [Planctomycetes bacterium]|nr:hypothetical protein [Planctomycetota bacterium]